MDCFIGCFGGLKDQKRRKRRIKRASPQFQGSHVYDAKLGNVVTADQTNAEKTSINLDSKSSFRDKPVGEGIEQLSRSPKKKVTFNSSVTTYEHVSLQDSIDSLSKCSVNIEKEKREDSVSEDAKSVISSVRSYPPNHRYHNARDSDDEAEEYVDSDTDLDDDDYYDDDSDEEDIYYAQTESLESGTENRSARDKSGYVHSVLTPVENITQWKAAKSEGQNQAKTRKENLTSNIEPPAPFSFKKNSVQEIAVNASLSNWLVSPEIATTPSKEQTMSQGADTCKRSYEDRPILGALTVEDVSMISHSPSPRKSPSRSPEEMPIIGSVGTYWNQSSFKEGIQSTRSKYELGV